MEKYTIVQHEQRLHWLKDCPVLLQSYALTKSNTNNSIFLQCKFENIADKSIKAMNIAVKCSDVSHQELANVGNFPYLDINVQPYTLFGDKTPVALPNNTTRNVCIIPLKIIFSDDTTWENTSERAYELAEYEQQPISSLGELADQYKRDLHKICTDSEKHNYLPANINGFTICGCSKVVLNNTESCPQCGINFQDLLNVNDSGKLHDHLTQYEAALAEKAQQEQLLEQERLQKAALAKQKFKTTAKKVGIIGSGVIAIALLGVLTKQVIIPNVQYSNAEHKAQSGEYDEAIQAFISLGDFKDASEKVLETKYNWAKDKLAQGDTEGAISLFSTLGDYSDARAQITEIQNQTQYDKAMAAYQAKQYADAQSIFCLLYTFRAHETPEHLVCRLLLEKTRNCRYNKSKRNCALSTGEKGVCIMDGTQWECNSSDTLLNDFFSQDDLKQLAVDAGIMLECPLLVLDDTFHVVAYYYPPGFVDNIFQEAVRCGQITYEAGAIISRSSALCSGMSDYIKLEESSFRRRFVPLSSAGVSLGYLVCVDTDGHLQQIPSQTWHTVEMILAKQLFVSASRKDKSFETAADILINLLDGGFSSEAYFQLQIANTYLAEFHPYRFLQPVHYKL